ncbi:PHB depolymerase family esterase [Lactiplantibacillus pentosus]|uniref:carboxylesterase family protein n=1 Tax=Lactiplantibacillus plantarum TaxID=1590 RepID=UPI001FF0D559|nr:MULTISPECIES: PHB depolymerase family esterase [Lactiplantibacillus]MDO7806408.1 PHB depolymerase family esterase [Lactiplantibacillus pentosus]
MRDDLFIIHSLKSCLRNQLTSNIYSINNNDTKSPLVIFLHGSGERGFNNNMPLLANDIPKKVYNYIKKMGAGVLVVPQTTWSADMTGWFRSEFQEGLMQLINKIIVEYSINRNRVYLIGLSNGASASWYLAQKYPDLFTAVIPCSGYVYNEGKKFLGEKGQGRYMEPTDEEAKKLLNVPIWAFHAEDDPTVNVLGTKLIVEKIKKFEGNNVKETIYPEGVVVPNPHASWSLAFKENNVLDWLFSQDKEKVGWTENNYEY